MSLSCLLLAFAIMSPFPFRSHLWPHNCLFSATAASAATDILPLSRDFSGEDAFPQQGMKEVGIEQVIEQGDDTPPEVKEANEAMKGTLEVKVGGNPVGLDDLGPIIINEDGTMRRIANWALLTPKEKAATSRRISTRNKKRLEKLQEKYPDSTSLNADDNDGDRDVMLLPESVPGPPVLVGDGSDDKTWPPVEEESGSVPPRSMF